MLAVRDQKEWEEFDLTSDGFFRSFAAILFVVPLPINIILLLNKMFMYLSLKKRLSWNLILFEKNEPCLIVLTSILRRHPFSRPYSLQLV